MRLKVNREKHIRHIVTIWSAYHRLTKLEEDLLCEIIENYDTVKNSVTDVTLIPKLFMDVEWKKKVQDRLGVSQGNLWTYIYKLVKKKCLLYDKGTYSLPQKFNLSTTITFEFVYGEASGDN